MRLAGVAARANSSPYLLIERLASYYFYVHRSNRHANADHRVSVNEPTPASAHFNVPFQ
jgi:hypothetical protein